MPLTVQNVFGLLLRSRLLAPADARALYERWQKEAKDQAGDVEKFRRWVVSHHYLTEYQANLLCKGHADDFFLNEYKILDRLGRGRMAGVYKAVHTSGQIVAIKVLPPSRAKDPYLLSRFLREAKLALRLNHPQVVRSFQVGEANRLNYIVMEYLEGETLDDVLYRRRRLPPAEAVRIIYQTLKGLQYIHEQGMVHRDIKPSNLMLTPARAPGQPDNTLNASVKILDIGLGRMFYDEDAPVTSEDQETQLTGDGVLLGTPDYLAPEQARNARGVDIRADVYSAGCVLHHCISGSPPFPDSNILNQIIRHAQETPRRLKEVNPEVSDGLQQVIDYMMAKDANQRYPTPEQAAQALLPFLSPGMEVIKAAPLDAQMSEYLIWLEKGNNGAAAPAGMPPPPPGRGSGRIPAPPPPPLPAAMPAIPVGKPVDSIKTTGQHKRKRRKVPVGAPAEPPPGMEFDVELVPTGVSAADTQRMGRPRIVVQDTGWISRRTLIVGALGVGAIAAAAAVGGILASGGVNEFLRRLGLASDE